jgi:hypothetical protein
MIDLSELLEENYNLFLENFRDNFEVKDEVSSYVVYKMSLYSLSNFDFETARKLAGLALRYKGNPNLTVLLKSNFTKIDWLSRNTNKVLSELKFNLN